MTQAPQLSEEELERNVRECVEQYNVDRLRRLKPFHESVLCFFLENPDLKSAIHSVTSRLKDPDHLGEKVRRKFREDGVIVTPENLYDEITDLAGVRILHLHQAQFGAIHRAISSHLEDGEWAPREPPRAYSWDPESTEFFDSFGIQTKLKPSNYTSVHYVVKPNPGSRWCCEIQVRTLFEEIWGEIDHALNYPKPTGSSACKEQIRVLAKLVATGGRLADSIFRTHEAFRKETEEKAVEPEH